MTSCNPCHHAGGIPLERFIEQDHVKSYICSVCKNVVDKPVQIHTDYENVKLACNSCFKDQLG